MVKSPPKLEEDAENFWSARGLPTVSATKLGLLGTDDRVCVARADVAVAGSVRPSPGEDETPRARSGSRDAGGPARARSFIEKIVRYFSLNELQHVAQAEELGAADRNTDFAPFVGILKSATNRPRCSVDADGLSDKRRQRAQRYSGAGNRVPQGMVP
jgi:hypothetical protein